MQAACRSPWPRRSRRSCGTRRRAAGQVGAARRLDREVRPVDTGLDVVERGAVHVLRGERGRAWVRSRRAFRRSSPGRCRRRSRPTWATRCSCRPPRSSPRSRTSRTRPRSRRCRVPRGTSCTWRSTASGCQLGRLKWVEKPLPDALPPLCAHEAPISPSQSFHTGSDPGFTSEVPPTAVTNGSLAGWSTSRAWLVAVELPS